MRITFTFFFVALFGLSAAKAQTFQWAKQLGGISSQKGTSVVVDGDGNVYSTGYFYDTTDFDPGVGVYHMTSNGTLGASYISKLDAVGNFVWAKKVQTNSQTWAWGIDLDQNNNVYVTGQFAGTGDFDPGAGTFNMTSAYGAQIFVLKLDAAGEFVWAKNFITNGLSGGESVGKRIKIDPLGNIYTAGYFVDTVDFDPGVATFQLVSNGNIDIFISKLDASGNFVWAKSFGGIDRDEVYDLELDDVGNVYTTGGFKDSVDFDPNGPAFDLYSFGSEVFISKLDASGNFVWAKHFEGGAGDYYGQGIALDADHNVYTTGYINSSVDMDPGPNSLYMGSGIGVIFVSKLNANGDYAWAKVLPTSGFGYGNAIAVNANSEVYITGGFMGNGDFDPGAGTTTLTAVGNMDVFILNLDSAGGFMNVWQMGSSTTDRGESIFVDATSSIYTTGTFGDSADFDPGAGTLTLTSMGNFDSFVQKIGNCLLNTGVTVSGNTLSANQPGASYQWMDCNLFAPVSGANGQSFTPTASGNYAVIVSQGTCADTSTCTTVTITQTDDALAAAAIQVYPNPATETLNIQSQEVIESITLTNLLGAVVQMETTDRFSVAALPQGVYVLRIQTASGLKNARFVKR